MALQTLIPLGVRGSGHTQFVIPKHTPGWIRLALISPTFGTDATLTFHMVVLRSFDGGVTFVPIDPATGQPAPYFEIQGSGGRAGTLNRNGTVWDGLPWIVTQDDGSACLLDVTVTAPTPFNWGVTGEIL